MIDLHLHLDGSLSPHLAAQLAQAQRLPLPGDLEKALRAPASCQSLGDYLTCFDLPLTLLQSAWALEKAAYSLCTRLHGQGLLYSELRFAPQLHTRQGLTQRQAAEAVCKGAAASPLHAQVILCCMRGGEDPLNRGTLETAAALLGQGICACDLAGAEALYPTKQYRPLFDYARSLGLPFTLHAGEAAGPESVYAALEMGAARIGHGVRAGEDPGLLQKLAAAQVPLELCYTSNLQTKAVPAPQDFPLRRYLAQGVCCTVNTDNMAVSGTTLWEEYHRLTGLGVTPEEKLALLQNACQAAFLPEPEKQRLASQTQAQAALWLQSQPDETEGGTT